MGTPVLVVMTSGTSTVSPTARSRPSCRLKLALVAVSPSVRLVAVAVSATLVASSSVTATSALAAVLEMV